MQKCGFGSRITGHARHRPRAVNRGNINDRAAMMIFHIGHGRTGAHIRRVHVDAKILLKTIKLGICDHPVPNMGGVIDQNIKPFTRRDIFYHISIGVCVRYI